MVENVVVGMIVGIVLVLAGRSFYRTLTGKSNECGCGNDGCGTPGSCSQSCRGTAERGEGMKRMSPYVEIS